MANRSGIFLLILALGVQLGCDTPIASFDSNLLYQERMELSERVELDGVERDINAALVELFGTPDSPRLPAFLSDDPAYSGLIDPERLSRAAGPVRSDEDDNHFGLFREHCVHCHGVTGNGLGPTSRFLNPYPRDFRSGIFKYKSTPIGKRPTRSDLHRTLIEGLQGTSMPSFRLLRSEDIDALLDYLVYLSVRGDVERKLINEAAFELDIAGGDRLYDPALKEADPDAYESQWAIIKDYVLEVADSWVEASQFALEVIGPPEGLPLYGRNEAGTNTNEPALKESIARGKEVYSGKVANCASCHGPTGMGDGQMSDYDTWTKEWTTSVALDPKDKQAIAPMVALGGLKPRNILPRNLRTGIYRGGSRPEDLYLRIIHGIDGTPMPAVAMQPENPLGLTESQVWDLVNYLLSLPDEEL